jgi:hypothetical protein
MTDILDRNPVVPKSEEKPDSTASRSPRGRVVQESIWRQPLEVQQAWREEMDRTTQELLAAPPLDMSDEELDKLIDEEISEVRREMYRKAKEATDASGGH